MPKTKRRRWSVVSWIVLAGFMACRDGSTGPPNDVEELAPDGPVDGTETGLLEFVRTVVVTPDSTFRTGSFSRINYVPSRDRFVVTFGTKADPGVQTCTGAGFAYKEYTLEMEETGVSGRLVWNDQYCEAGDTGSVMVGDTCYFVVMPITLDHPLHGWQAIQYQFDAEGVEEVRHIEIVLEEERETSNDPMVAFVNGMLDVSAQYNATGAPPIRMEDGAATHHRFYSPDLEVLGLRILDDTPHIGGSSMIFVDGIYYMVTADGFAGDLILMRYDADWNFLGSKKLVDTAHWSQGIVFDGRRFYVSYLNTSQRSEPGFLPVYLNVRLAVFDRDFNLIEDLAVTDFRREDLRQPGRPHVIIHDGLLYVSYDIDTITVNGDTFREDGLWQAYVSIYRIKDR